MFNFFFGLSNSKLFDFILSWPTHTILMPILDRSDHSRFYILQSKFYCPSIANLANLQEITKLERFLSDFEQQTPIKNKLQFHSVINIISYN